MSEFMPDIPYREKKEIPDIFGPEKKIKLDPKILEKLDSEDLSLDDSIAEYEKAIKLIKDSEKLLEIGEGKVLKVLEKNGKVETEDLD